MEERLGYLAFLFIEVCLVWTGEIVKFIISLGRYKPDFQQSTQSYCMTSLVLGLGFWTTSIISLYYILR
jgi:hypothetical protein